MIRQMRWTPLTLPLLVLALFSTPIASRGPPGYMLPSTGTASTTQFQLGPELGSGTSCGMSAWPNGINAGNPPDGAGPGFLYAAINQLGFGANPSVPNGGGPGAACGVCYNLAPIDAAGHVLYHQALTFMIVDECPASQALQRGPGGHCAQCKAGDKNGYGQQWHFDIAVDAMNQEQYQHFHRGCTGGRNWHAVSFSMGPCNPVTTPNPPIKPWGCINGQCPNNNRAGVCQGI